MILKAYKTELDPNNEQRTFLMRCAGTARFIYNCVRSVGPRTNCSHSRIGHSSVQPAAVSLIGI